MARARIGSLTLLCTTSWSLRRRRAKKVKTKRRKKTMIRRSMMIMGMSYLSSPRFGSCVHLNSTFNGPTSPQIRK